MQQMLYLRNGGAEELGLAVYIGEVVESEFGDQLSVVLENPLAHSLLYYLRKWHSLC